MKKGLLAVALLGLSLVAGGALAEPKPVIGALIRNLDDQFLGDYTGNLKKLAVSKGVELKVMDAHSDMATQLDQLNTLISQGVKYFVVVPAVTEGSEQLASIIAAKKGGAAFSNTAPTVAALKKSSNFFSLHRPNRLPGRSRPTLLTPTSRSFRKNLARKRAST